MHILSICRFNNQINEKNAWPDKYAPFFKKDKRAIISKECNPHSSKKLKLDYLQSLNTKEQIVLIDDDNEILKTIQNNLKEIILFQDSELID